MARVIWTADAESCLDKIAGFIALDNLSAAAALRARIIEASKGLANFPLSGRRIPELPRKEYRELIVGPCRVFYRVRDKKVYIVFIMRAEREFRAYLIENQQREKVLLHDKEKVYFQNS